MRQRCRFYQGEAVLFGSPRIQKEKAARRRLLYLRLMILDQIPINAGFDFRR